MDTDALLDKDEFPTSVEPEAPAVKPKRKGPNAGITKAMKPKLANRLPRERGGIIAPLGDGLTPFERAIRKLGNRVVAKKTHYVLDGRPCNASDIMKAAGFEQ